ncbi:GNAT family N-acetyltransferase [Salininema proteolyticum]|uniref:GNAT family N-acetyltransferase n=1 Tax=Salininema proteolyticum TaxID=1607685 RepID=A0ABV8U0M6_9ACTN
MDRTRLVAVGDAPELARLASQNRDFLAPWEPERSGDYFTVRRQHRLIESALELAEAGTMLPHVILDSDGGIAGRITLSGITRGAFYSCNAGYWVSADANGKGLATEAVAEMREIAFDDLGLHRVQAETLPHNVASQRVLAKTGFQRIGFAPEFLRIAGRWQDHVIYQVVNEDWREPGP